MSRHRAGPGTGHASVTVSATALHHLVITPASVTLKPAAAAAFSVEGRGAQDNPIPVTPTWAVVNGGGTIGAQGIFVAGTATGTFADTVQASASGLSVTATVVVEPGPLNVIQLTPAHASLTPGQTQQFTARGTDAWGNPVPLTALVWSCDPDAGTITADALFTAGPTSGDWAAGVTATMDTVVASAGIRITGGAAADGSTGADAGGPPAAAGGGCGCRLGGGAAAPLGGLALLALALLAARRRRPR